MPLEIACDRVGIIVYKLVKELKKSLEELKSKNSIRIFVATHKRLLVSIDNTLDKDFIAKNVIMILDKYNIECSLK